jgi:hypothetical protein
MDALQGKYTLIPFFAASQALGIYKPGLKWNSMKKSNEKKRSAKGGI